MTSMTGKGAEAAKELLTNLAVDAVRTIAEDGLKKIDIDHIKLEKKTGGSTKDTNLIRGHGGRQRKNASRNAKTRGECEDRTR